MGTNGHLNL
jgi:hypothetical protein